jgi:hypothetical protein
MFPFLVTIPVTVPQRSEIPEGLMNNPVYLSISIDTINSPDDGHMAARNM